MRCAVSDRVSARDLAAFFHVDEEIVSFIPDLLADFDELGTFPEQIAQLLRDAGWKGKDAAVVDLGCGFGAVSRAIAREFGCRLTGVDMLEAFVVEAGRRAETEGLGHLCRFVCSDVGDYLDRGDRFDVALLLSVGDVLGPMDRTVGRLRQVVRPGGYIVIDDGYTASGKPIDYPGYEYLESRETVLAQLTSHGDEIVCARTITPDEMKEQDRIFTERIEGRVRELSQRHPQHRLAFERYLENERKECEILESEVICESWLLRRAVSGSRADRRSSR